MDEVDGEEERENEGLNEQGENRETRGFFQQQRRVEDIRIVVL